MRELEEKDKDRRKKSRKAIQSDLNNINQKILDENMSRIDKEKKERMS